MDKQFQYCDMKVPKDELVEYVKPILKAKGVTKKGFRWAKEDLVGADQ